MEDTERYFNIEQMVIRAGIERSRNTRRTLVPTGKCLNCDETVGLKEQYCEDSCRDSHLKRLRLSDRTH